MVTDWMDLMLPQISAASTREIEAYLLGAAHDATYSRLHRTTRFCQADERWIHVLGVLLRRIGQNCWFYREGAGRGCWVAETGWTPPTTTFETAKTKIAYVRGYFDAEGGIPKHTNDRFYIQFVQQFARLVGSWHPRKRLALEERFGGISSPRADDAPDGPQPNRATPGPLDSF